MTALSLIHSRKYSISLGIFRTLFNTLFLYTLFFIYIAIDNEVTAISPIYLKLLLTIEMFFSLFMIFGFKYDLVKIIYVPLGLMVQYFLFYNQTPVFALFFVNSFVLVQHLFLPLNSSFSVDKLLSKDNLKITTVKNYNYFFPLFLLGLVYFDGGMIKLFDSEWSSNAEYFFQLEYTFSISSNLQSFSDNFITNFLVSHPVINKLFLQLTVVYQLTFIGFVFLEYRIKKYFILIGLFLHFGIGIMFNFWIVSLAIVALYFLIIPPKNVYKILIKLRHLLRRKGKSIIVYYDSSCPSCSKYIFLLKIFDFTNRITLKPSALENEAEIIIDINRKRFYGVDGFQTLFGEIFYMKILYYLLKVKVIYKLAQHEYRKFASNRHKVSCEVVFSIPRGNYIYYRNFIFFSLYIALLLRFTSGDLLRYIRNFSQITGVVPSLTIFTAGNPSYVSAYFLRVDSKEILPYNKKDSGYLGHILFTKSINNAIRESQLNYSQEQIEKFKKIHFLDDKESDKIELCLKRYDFRYFSPSIKALQEEKNRRVKDSKDIFCRKLVD